MDYQNPYAAPNSDLTPSSQNTGKPTIEEALARGYDFEVFEVIGEAWQKVRGFKLISFLAHVVYFIGFFILAMLISWIPFFGNLIVTSILGVIYAGLYGLALAHYRNEPISIGNLFKYFSLFLPVFLLFLLIDFFTLIGFFLLMIPGIYLYVSYRLGTLVLIDNPELSFWDAMEASRKGVSQHWFKFAFVLLIIYLIELAAAIPIIVAMIPLLMSFATMSMNPEMADPSALMIQALMGSMTLMSVGFLIMIAVLFWTVPLKILSVTAIYERIFGER